jgi:hypothetical protein
MATCEHRGCRGPQSRVSLGLSSQAHCCWGAACGCGRRSPSPTPWCFFLYKLSCLCFHACVGIGNRNPSLRFLWALAAHLGAEGGVRASWSVARKCPGGDSTAQRGACPVDGSAAWLSLGLGTQEAELRWPPASEPSPSPFSFCSFFSGRVLESCPGLASTRIVLACASLAGMTGMSHYTCLTG